MCKLSNQMITFDHVICYHTTAYLAHAWFGILRRPNYDKPATFSDTR